MNRVSRAISMWWLHRRADVALIFERRAAAIDAYREMAARDPANEFAPIMLGNLLADAGDHRGATAELRRLTEINPSNADAWFNLGFLHDKVDELDDAERCFRRAVQLKPSLDRAWYGLALVLIRNGRLSEAVDALKQNVRLQPYSPYGYYQLGMTYHHLGRSKEAWATHKTLAEFEPKFSATLKHHLEQTPSRSVQTAKFDSTPKEDITTEAT